MRKAAIWARTSTTDQHPENQLEELTRWCADRGVEVVKVFIVEDSAWTRRENSAKGAQFDKDRAELVEGVRMGFWEIAVTWALDRLSRRGYSDLGPFLESVRRHGGEVWSHEEKWLNTVGPFGEIIEHLFSWIAKQQSDRKAADVSNGMQKAAARYASHQHVKNWPCGKCPGGKHDGFTLHRVGGRKPGAKDKKPRRNGYTQEAREKIRAAALAREAAKREASAA